MRIVRGNLHAHTVFSDGVSTAEEYVQAALEKGLGYIGFSEHAWAPYDSACCIREEEIPEYYSEVERLREKYGHRLDIYIGWENDYYHPWNREHVDYLIGSAHYMKDAATGKYHTIDHLPEMFEEAVGTVGEGDVRKLVAKYFSLVEDIALNQRPDIIGHMDLITKLNEANRYFDVDSQWYTEIIDKTIESIAKSGCIVEVNTGGMFRGYTTVPYPSPAILGKLQKAGVPVMINSDCHTVEALDYRFPEMLELLREIGFTTVKQMEKGRLVDTTV